MSTSEKPALHSYVRKNLTKNDRIVLAVLKAKGAGQDFIILPQVVLSLITRIQQSKISVALDRLTYKGYVERMKASKFDAIRIIKKYP